MKASWKAYWQPTPKRMRIWGDALFSTFGSVGVGAGFMEHGNIASIFFILAMVGKFLTNFFKEDAEEIPGE